MTTSQPITPEQVYIGRIAHGGDLLAELTALCAGKNITLGSVQAIGAVRRATIGYYDQADRTYAFETIDEPMEILTLSGNVSQKDGQPMVHAHVTLSRADGSAIGGHLAEGTEVFACEYILRSYSGAELNRSYDEPTGLPLWEM
jgi:uncharacterized protein